MRSVISEEYYDVLQARLAIVDQYAFDVCEYLTYFWNEAGQAIIEYKKKEQGWSDKQAPGRAHRWWLASSAAKVGASEGTLYNYKRVGDNFINRGYLQDNLTLDHCLALILNTEKDDTGLVPDEVIEERLDWLNKETDNNQGQVPSARDIRNHYKKNGEKEEWEIIWNTIVNQSKKLLELEDVPTSKYKLAREIVEIEPTVSSVGADSGGGTSLE